MPDPPPILRSLATAPAPRIIASNRRRALAPVNLQTLRKDAMKKLPTLIPLSLLLLLGLAACSSAPRASDADRLAFYQAHAGEPVNSFRMFGRLSGWTPLGTGALTVWTRPNEAFLLDVSPCHDLPFAQAITISNFANTVSARFDTVTPVGPGLSPNARFPCRITQIRPIDVAALNQSREEIRQANTEARQEEAPASRPPA